MEQPVQVSCPWCGEFFDTFYDLSQGDQDYVEDCQVCCRPIIFQYAVDESGNLSVVVDRE